MSTTITAETYQGPRTIKYTALVSHLKNNPGTWFKVRTAATEPGAWAAAHQIKTGRRAAFRPAEEFEAYTEGCDIVARYVGGPCHTTPLSPGTYCATCATYSPDAKGL